MNINRFDRIRFIYNGKQISLKIMFGEYKFNIVPLYYSDDIQKIELITFSDNTSMLIANKEYISINKNDIEILEILLEKALQTKNRNIIDLHIAYWFGYSKVISYIRALCNIDDYSKKQRINFLEHAINNKNVRLNSIEDIIKNINFISIKE